MKVFSFSILYKVQVQYSTVLYKQSLSRQQRREEGLTIIPIPSYNTAKFLLSSDICTAQEAHKSIISIQKKEANENLMSNKRKPNCLRPTVMPQRCPSYCKNPRRREKKKREKSQGYHAMLFKPPKPVKETKDKKRKKRKPESLLSLNPTQKASRC